MSFLLKILIFLCCKDNQFFSISLKAGTNFLGAVHDFYHLYEVWGVWTDIGGSIALP